MLLTGDGNFAVVRICKDKTTAKEYALKIIDKAKCKGKEHYVEAEVKFNVLFQVKLTYETIILTLKSDWSNQISSMPHYVFNTNGL